ncbi:hypothetical protein ACFL6T_00215 [Candidatus Zixiibacteriota bacterium]
MMTGRRSFSAMMMIVPLMMAMAFSSAEGQAVSGSLHAWPVGQSAEFEITRGEVQTLEVPGREASPTSSSTTMKVTVTSIGSRRFKLLFTGANTTSTALDVAPLIGLECQVTLDERGLITELSGTEGNAFVEGRGGDDLFREDLQLLFLYLPESGLVQDAEWDRSHSLTADQGGFEMERRFEETFHCVEEATFNGTLSMKVSQKSDTRFDGSGDQSGTEMVIELAGVIESDIHVDLETGRLLHLKGSGRLDGFLIAQGMDIVMVLEVSIEIRKVG